MIPDLSPIASAIAHWLLVSSAQLALLVVLLIPIAWMAGRLPARIRYGLWLLVFIKAVLPPGIGWVGAVGNWGLAPAQEFFFAARAPDSALSGHAGELSALADEEESDATSASAPVLGASPRGESSALGQSLAGVWILGVCGFAGIVWWKRGRLMNLLAEAHEITEGPWRVDLERLAMELGLRQTPRLLASPKVQSPFLCGALRPSILLPEALLDTLTPKERRYILLHELIHWKRGDLFVGWGQVIIQAVYWFHPLMWWAGARIRHERECACDEAVLAHEKSGEVARPYAESILKVLLEARARPSFSPGILGIFERHAQLQHRLEEIMRYERKSKMANVLGWSLVICVAGALVPMAPVAQTLSAEAQEAALKAAQIKSKQEALSAQNPAATSAPSSDSAASQAGYLVRFRPPSDISVESATKMRQAFSMQLPDGMAVRDFKAEKAAEGVECSFVANSEKCVEYMFKYMQAQNWNCALIEMKPLSLSPGAANPQTAAVAAIPQSGQPPRILGTSPAVGALEVNPATAEITVTFDQDMNQGGFSWTGGGPDYPPIREGQKPFWRDARTCVLPVTLAPAKYYRVGINSKSHRNFRSAAGIPAFPSAIYFVTQGADEATKARVTVPVIVSMSPANGAANVDPNLRELRVTFNVPMGSGCSWTGGGEDYPTIPEGQRPSWSADKKTAILPVQLAPNHSYRLGINSPSHRNFQSEGGIPVEPVLYTFTTGPGGR